MSGMLEIYYHDNIKKVKHFFAA